VLRGVLMLVVLGAAGVAVAGLIPGSSARLSHPDGAWIAAAVALELIAIASYAWLFHLVFSHGAHTTRPARSGQIAVGELGAFAVVPTGAGGPALRIWALVPGGMPFSTVMERTVVHAPVLNIPYVLAALVLGMGAVLHVGSGHAPVLVALAPLGIVIVTVVLAVAAALYVCRHRSEPRAGWRRVGFEALQAIPDGVRALPARLRNPVLLLAATGYWAGDCGVLIVAFHAVHGSAPVAVIALAYMLGQLGNSLPLPGGIGGVEPVMLAVLTASGVNVGLGAAAVVLYRLISLGLQTIAGVIAVGALMIALRETPQAA
jgi:putative heme transporter